MRSGSTASAPASRSSAALARPLATASDLAPPIRAASTSRGESATYTVASSPNVTPRCVRRALARHPQQRALGVGLGAVAADVEIDEAVQAEGAQLQHRRSACCCRSARSAPRRRAWPRRPAPRPRPAAAGPALTRSSLPGGQRRGQFGAERLEQAARRHRPRARPRRSARARRRRSPTPTGPPSAATGSAGGPPPPRTPRRRPPGSPGPHRPGSGRYSTEPAGEWRPPLRWARSSLYRLVERGAGWRCRLAGPDGWARLAGADWRGRAQSGGISRGLALRPGKRRRPPGARSPASPFPCRC